MKKRQPKAYSLEFREEALRQVQAGTTPIRRLAQEPGAGVIDAGSPSSSCAR